MSCKRFRRMLGDAAMGGSFPELESHLSGCEACRAALAGERALLDRIDAELQECLETKPSLAFLPAVRRRVDEIQAQRQSTRPRWLVPALATLVGLLVGGHFVREAARGPTAAVSPVAGPTAPTASQQPAVTDPGTSVVASVGPVEPSPGPARMAGVPTARPEPAIAPSLPRAFVPPEDELAVRRLVRRLRGRAARASALAPTAEGPFDFTLKPVEERQDVVSLDDLILQGAAPDLGEPLSYDLTVENSGRET
jgi:hypothetical protein